MREFLSQNSVEFEDRNIAKEPGWRTQLRELTGEIVVPVLVVNGKQVIGLDDHLMAEALGLADANFSANRDGLEAPPELSRLPEQPDDSMAGPLTHFVPRLQREKEFNAPKDGSPYPDGPHARMTIARDAILRQLPAQNAPAQRVPHREPDQPAGYLEEGGRWRPEPRLA